MSVLRARLALTIVTALLCVAVTIRARAEVVKNVAPPFALTVPDGFVAHPEQIKADQIVAFHRAGLSGGELGTIIAVDRMRGTIGREKPSLADVGKLGGGDKVTIEGATWKGSEIWMIRMTQNVAGKDLVFFLAQVPLAPEAIQVKVAVDAKNEADGRAIMARLLRTVEGESSWVKAPERNEKLGVGTGKLVFVGIFLLIVVALAVRKVRA